jgi:hypothetical protein
VSGPERQRAEALERLEWIADAYLPVSAPVQICAAGWLGMGRGIQETSSGGAFEGLERLRRAAGG